MKKIYIFIIFLAFISFIMPHHVFALEGGQQDFPGADLTIQKLENMLRGLACWIYRIAFFLIIIFILVVGIRYLTSSGSPEKITTVNQSFKWIVIGSAVILGVGTIIATIAWALGLPVITPLFCS